ncbi:MAG: DUF938 domain-containing protein [Hyphomonas sp.]
MADRPPVALESRNEGGDGRRYSPSAARNREPIRDVLAPLFKAPARVLEIASGTGEHGAFLTSQFPDLHWTYSDIDPESLISQNAWAQADETGRLAGPLRIDAATENWQQAEGRAPWDAIFSANMVHIAPWAAAQGLIRGAGRLLRSGGSLILYGPFARDGVFVPSNAAFNDSLKARNPEWGVRDLVRELVPLAASSSLALNAVTDMPANNLTVVFGKN